MTGPEHEHPDGRHAMPAGHTWCEDRDDPGSWEDAAIRGPWADPLPDGVELDAETWTHHEPPGYHHDEPEARRLNADLARRGVGVYLDDLPEVIRAAGLAVWADPGWQRRAHAPFVAIRAIVCHHTGSSGAGAWTVVRDGRPGLEGPLAQLTIERDGSVRVLAHGQAWHAGTGSWPSIGANNANSVALGIECVYNGADITDAQRATYPRLCAALARQYRIPVSNIIGHREWAPTRKVDPGHVDLPGLRRDVAALLGGAPGPAVPAAPAAAPADTPTAGGDDVSVQNFPGLTGTGTLILGAPVGGGAWTSDGYLSVTVAGGRGSARVFAQGPTAGVADWWHPESELTVNTAAGAKDTNLARRSIRRIPQGTSVLKIGYDFTAAGPDGGTITLELR